MTQSRKSSALRSLVSETCPFCQGRKRRSQSFCRLCYFKLPATSRQALYHRFGEGYEEALDAAEIWLQAQAAPKAKAVGAA